MIEIRVHINNSERITVIKYENKDDVWLVSSETDSPSARQVMLIPQNKVQELISALNECKNNREDSCTLPSMKSLKDAKWQVKIYSTSSDVFWWGINTSDDIGCDMNYGGSDIKQKKHSKTREDAIQDFKNWAGINNFENWEIIE